MSDRDGAPGAPQTDTGRTAAARSGHHADRLGRSHLAAEHEFMIKVVGQALGELWRHDNRSHREEDGGGGQQASRRCVNLKRASDDRDVVVLSPERTNVVAAKAELKPRIPRKQSTSSLVHCVNNSHSLYAHSGHASAAQTGHMTCTRPQAESHTCAAQTGRAHDLHPTAS